MKKILKSGLSPRPLDIILKFSGSLKEINEIPWLGNRSIKFVINK